MQVIQGSSSKMQDQLVALEPAEASHGKFRAVQSQGAASLDCMSLLGNAFFSRQKSNLIIEKQVWKGPPEVI